MPLFSCSVSMTLLFDFNTQLRLHLFSCVHLRSSVPPSMRPRHHRLPALQPILFYKACTDSNGGEAHLTVHHPTRNQPIRTLRCRFGFGWPRLPPLSAIAIYYSTLYIIVRNYYKPYKSHTTLHTTVILGLEWHESSILIHRWLGVFKDGWIGGRI